MSENKEDCISPMSAAEQVSEEEEIIIAMSLTK